eukprot:EG_transcript_9903
MALGGQTAPLSCALQQRRAEAPANLWCTLLPAVLSAVARSPYFVYPPPRRQNAPTRAPLTLYYSPPSLCALLTPLPGFDPGALPLLPLSESGPPAHMCRVPSHSQMPSW